MATTSDTAAQTARGNGMNWLFTSKNLTPAQRRLKRVIIGIWVILAYGVVCVLVGNDPWTIWRLYGGLAALGVPLLVLVFWFPVVWASLRWLARVAWRYASLYYLTPYVQDWRLGTVRHEAVTCRDFRVDNSIANYGRGNARVMYEFELVSSDGSSWKYREEKKWMDHRVEAGEQPYATVIEACRSEGAEIGIVVYPHSGTIIEAWRNH